MAAYPSQARLGNRLNAFRLNWLAQVNARAILDARSGIARSGASRSNYFKRVNVVLGLNGNNLSQYIRYGTLTVHQALNEEPDTCGFTLVPDNPIMPRIGDEVVIGLGTITNREFGGRVVTVQHRRESGRRKPFIDVLCSDYLPDFDQRLVSWAWPAQSATTTILDLVARFCQHQPGATFGTDRVVAGLPSLEAFSVTNARPSEVLQRITGLLGGGFYIDADRIVHAWAGDYEPGFVDPRPLALDLFTLKAFAHTEEGAQARTMLVVEGQRTTTPAGLPDMPGGLIDRGIPLADATPWRQTALPVEARVGSQRVIFEGPLSPPIDPGRQRQTTVTTIFGGDGATYVSIGVADPSIFAGYGPSHYGWCTLAGRYVYFGFDGASAVILSLTGFGAIPAAPAIGADLTLVESVMNVSGTTTIDGGGATRTPLLAQAPGSDVVVVVRQPTTRVQTWPPKNVEHLVSDGRYSYDGARERARIELLNFDHVEIKTEWETDDPNARPGRKQSIELDPPDPLTHSVVILSSDLTFPLAEYPPRRRCTGAAVKQANILDIVLTSQG